MLLKRNQFYAFDFWAVQLCVQKQFLRNKSEAVFEDKAFSFSFFFLLIVDHDIHREFTRSA
jgi:hypothetical protein